MEKTKRKMKSAEPADAKKALSYQNLFWFFMIGNVLGMRAWDYSSRPFNIKGRITLGMTFVWGTLGILFIKYVVPKK